MKKINLFVENFLIYGLCGIISNVIPLIMIPIITRLMPNPSFYGIGDLVNTVIGLATPVAIFGMYDAMYRLFFEKEDDDYKKEICTTTLAFIIFSSFIIFSLMLLFKDNISLLFWGEKKYSYLVYISAITTVVTAMGSIFTAPTRMQNKRIIFLVTNFINSIITYSITVSLLKNGQYLLALPISGAISGITIGIFFYIINYKWFSVRYFNSKHLKPLLSIAIPVLPNFLVYWVFNSCDKVMISKLMNISEVGIYSVGSKLGLASQLIYTAFAGGWQYFAFSTMKESNQVESNSRIFEYLGIIAFTTTAYICAFSYPIYKFIFPENYLRGFIVSPSLFLAPLLQMLYQVASNQFLIIKKTFPNLLILLFGMIANVILNLILIPIMGIEGAAIATVMGYIIADYICCYVLVKMKLMLISKKFICACLIICMQFIIWRVFFAEKFIHSFILALITTMFYILIYYKDILWIHKMILGVTEEKNHSK